MPDFTMRRSALGAMLLALVGLTAGARAWAVPVEADVVREWNALRADPPRYARLLEAWLPLFRGTELQRPSGRLATHEGPAAVREAIAVLRATQPLALVQLSAGMTAAARDHVRDLGPRGGLGHVGADGSTVGQRLDRHGQWQGVAFEAISYGATTAQETILELLVDDGTPSRGHRAALLFAKPAQVGVACGVHQVHQSLCVLDLASQFAEPQPVRVAARVPPDSQPFDESKPFAAPFARAPSGTPSEFDLAIVAEVNGLRTNPRAWAAKLTALLPLFKGAVLERPGRVSMYWNGAPQSVTQAIAMLEATPPQPPAQLLASLAAGARDYVRVRANHPAAWRGHYSALGAVRRYGSGRLSGELGMEGEGEAFDIVATWVVQGRGPNKTLLSQDATQIGVACGPAVQHPLMCTLVYANGFADYNAADLQLVQAAMARLDAARTDPHGEAQRLRQLLPLVQGETLRRAAGAADLPGGKPALQQLIARLDSAKALPSLKPSADLQARAHDLVQELARGREPGDPGSWSLRPASRYGQPSAKEEPEELTLFAPGDGEHLALRILLQQPEWLLARDELSVGLWCGNHATKRQACVVDVGIGWVTTGPDLP